MTLLMIPTGYTEREAAKMLSDAGWTMSETALRKERENGHIRHRRVAGRIRYTLDDIQAYLQRGTVWETTELEVPGGGSPSKDTGSERSPGLKPSMPAGTIQPKVDPSSVGASARAILGGRK